LSSPAQNRKHRWCYFPRGFKAESGQTVLKRQKEASGIPGYGQPGILKSNFKGMESVYTKHEVKMFSEDDGRGCGIRGHGMIVAEGLIRVLYQSVD
jgi:hypothetical protein